MGATAGDSEEPLPVVHKEKARASITRQVKCAIDILSRSALHVSLWVTLKVKESAQACLSQQVSCSASRRYAHVL